MVHTGGDGGCIVQVTDRHWYEVGKSSAIAKLTLIIPSQTINSAVLVQSADVLQSCADGSDIIQC